jgi:hypothetical protein
MQLLLCLVYPFPILAVDDKDKALCASVIMPPKWPNLVLSTHVPNVELYVFVSDGLHVESDYQFCRQERERRPSNLGVTNPLVWSSLIDLV